MTPILVWERRDWDPNVLGTQHSLLFSLSPYNSELHRQPHIPRFKMVSVLRYRAAAAQLQRTERKDGDIIHADVKVNVSFYFFLLGTQAQRATTYCKNTQVSTK